MQMNVSKDRKESFEFKKSESELRTEISQLKTLLELKEQELKSATEAPFLKDEILRIREKISKEQEEYEKIKETGEKEKERQKEKPRQDAEKAPAARARSAQPYLKVKKTAAGAKDPDISHQVAILVNLAFTKGIYYAVKNARSLNNPYLLDRFHDTLVNELYDQLVKHGKIKFIK